MITLNATRWTYNAEAGIDHDIDRLTSVRLAAATTVVRYTGDDAPSFTGYKSTSASAQLLRQLTKRTSANAAFNVARYEFDDPAKPASTTYNAAVGATSRLTKRLTFRASGGARWIDTDGFGTSTGAIWSVGLEYAPLKNSKIAVDASRSVAPSSFGEVDDTTSAGISLEHQLAPRVKVTANYRVSSSAAIDRRLIGVTGVYTINRRSTLTLAANDNTYSSASDDRHLLLLSASYTCRLTPELEASLSYKYTRKDSTSVGVATSNAVMLTLSRPFDVFR